MEAEQWLRIEELFHAASELPAEDRVVFLRAECAGNEVLLQEVESLIAASEGGNSFFEQPALSLGMKVLSNGTKATLTGQSIGHYKVLQLLGEGGMGAVYLAEDCTLERNVALKFIAPGLVDDDWAKNQLIKEARAVAKLENPNICAVHGIEEVGDFNFIVMQYVEGDTLASLLCKGALELDQALYFAEQIAGALAAAHLRGIIHRDVKPQNIAVNPEGQIKVLDFGLAKFTRQQQNVKLLEGKLDQTIDLGLVVGTVAYMSPEQTEGSELDCRSDIFSFGIVLHEMLRGKNPFLRETLEETILAIRTEPPPQLPPYVPKDLAEIAGHCLQKDPEQRLESGEQLVSAIRGLRKKRERRHSLAYYRDVLWNHQHFRLYAAAALTLLVILIAGGVHTYSKITKVHTLAVLPILNQSGDPNKDYLSEGLTRNLFDKFSYLPRLKVKLPTVIPSRQNEHMVQLGRELRAEAVLTGELFKQGESLLLRLTMFNTANGTATWEQTFNLDSANMFALQDEVTGKVTSALGLWLIGGEKNLLAKRQTNSQKALEAYTRGRYYWGLKRDRQNIQTAIQFFDQAIDLDPAFAKAYAGRSDCYVLMSNVLYGPLSTKDAMDKARADARQALEIDPALSEAHTSMGTIRFRHDWDWQEAEKEFKLAIDLDPEYAPARYGYANLLASMHRFDEAILQSQSARSSDPHSRISAMNFGRALYYSRRFDEAAGHFAKLLEASPRYAQGLHMMGLVQIQQGNYSNAITTLETLHAKDPLHTAAALGYAYGKAGKHTDALAILKELESFDTEQSPLPPLEKALVHIGLGNRDKAFHFLELAYQDRFANLTFLTTDPLYDDLRTDPRFVDLARRIGLTL